MPKPETRNIFHGTTWKVKRKNIADTTFQARECYTNKDILKAKTRRFYI